MIVDEQTGPKRDTIYRMAPNEKPTEEKRSIDPARQIIIYHPSCTEVEQDKENARHPLHWTRGCRIREKTNHTLERHPRLFVI